MNIHNPYAAPNNVESSSVAFSATGRLAAYMTGFRTGALWSLVVAVPLCLFFYVNNEIHMGYQRNPATGTFRTDFTMQDYLGCAANAIASTATGVTLPWALVAGFVNMFRSSKGVPSGTQRTGKAEPSDAPKDRASHFNNGNSIAGPR